MNISRHQIANLNKFLSHFFFLRFCSHTNPTSQPFLYYFFSFLNWRKNQQKTPSFLGFYHEILNLSVRSMFELFSFMNGTCNVIDRSGLLSASDKNPKGVEFFNHIYKKKKNMSCNVKTLWSKIYSFRTWETATKKCV